MDRIIDDTHDPAKDIKIISYRGLITHLSIMLETDIEECLALYFCGPSTELRKQFIHFVLCKEQFNLSFKSETLSFIITANFIEFKNKYPKFSNTLSKFIKERNLCAHKKFHGKDQPDEKPWHFEQYGTKDGVQKIIKHQVLGKESALIIKDVAEMGSQLDELYEMIKKFHQPELSNQLVK